MQIKLQSHLASPNDDDDDVNMEGIRHFSMRYGLLVLQLPPPPLSTPKYVFKDII